MKRFIRRLIPKSSALLSTRYRKYFSQKLTNINMSKFWKSCGAIKMQKCIRKENLKITNLCTKIQKTNKCNMQRIKTSDKCFLFVCGDIESNPGPP